MAVEPRWQWSESLYTCDLGTLTEDELVGLYGDLVESGTLVA